ncbi:MAG: hypothetical protein U0794_18325 [Isosphaeraceae bacterium]
MTGSPEAPRAPSSPGQPALVQVRWLCSALASYTLLMVGISWPLWRSGGSIPRVPFVAGIPPSPDWLAYGLPLGLTLGLLKLGRRPWWSVGYLVSTCVAVWLVLQDQHRFQPWIYQYIVVGLPLAVFRAGSAIWIVRLCYISIYVHSALSKLDVSFCDELGTKFLATGLVPLGLDPMSWPTAGRYLAVLSMPFGELGVGIALLTRRFRRLGLIGATIMHGLLIAILGPFGLGHSAIVQFWNLAILTEVWIAFGSRGESDGSAPVVGPRRMLSRLLELGVVGVLVMGMLLPFLQRSGWFDAWPSHALYASHVEWLTIELPEELIEGPAQELARFARPGSTEPWHTLDLTEWSRAERGTPLYPQNRATLGLAESLAARYVERSPVRVILHGQASWWSGRRTRTELQGLEAIRRQAERYRINAHPAP